MTEVNHVKSKLLILDHDQAAATEVAKFCEANNIIALKPSAQTSLDIINNNTDLGGIIVSDAFSIDDYSGDSLIQELHYKRPELPLFIRGQSPSDKSTTYLSGSFTLNNMDELKQSIDKHLFTTYYPIPLIRGMQEISLEAINANIKQSVIEVDPPYLVKDQIIYGELLSLIPLESNWYRGYMMLQTTEQEVVDVIQKGLTPINKQDTDFRFVNAILNEITNLIWGGIKNKFSSVGNDDNTINTRTQVPISINHHHRYISFGTTDPQLCFHYRIRGVNDSVPYIDIYQKFIFNLSWYPDDFENCDSVTDKLVESGELEFF